MRTALCHLSLPGSTALAKLMVGQTGLGSSFRLEQTLRLHSYALRVACSTGPTCFPSSNPQQIE
uniref:Uncharacterized protein n=1 Tax=Utricularia reniformis TaxID=192314 RepID=A0A1Y0B1T4_9LAMI|nr:hypothetical protein AEK19_MT1166 [Utricularia reniformis]ART31380.1 hypothetical protein AEK19_MT1166 [Utricularia reniformis]